MADDDRSDEPVDVTVELSGSYGDISSILGQSDAEYDEIEPLTEDIEVVLRVIARTGGATKSQIADDVSRSTTIGFDADTVIHVLRVLELYDLVELDGNTWKPGPALGSN